jgi:heterotetrameric sarcosine oxidase delta subunit
MLLIPCPCCGARDQTEFVYGGDAAARRPADPSALSDEDWSAFLHLRANPAGEHDELWQHAQGCRRWIGVRRNTLTHAIMYSFAVGAATDPAAGADAEPRS